MLKETKLCADLQERNTTTTTTRRGRVNCIRMIPYGPLLPVAFYPKGDVKGRGGARER